MARNGKRAQRATRLAEHRQAAPQVCHKCETQGTFIS